MVAIVAGSLFDVLSEAVVDCDRAERSEAEEAEV